VSEAQVESRVKGIAERLSQNLANALVEGKGMNDFLGRLLAAVSDACACPRLALYDYDERSDVFYVLAFRGYPHGDRARLGRHLKSLDVRRALTEREPYWQERQLIVPLYFQEALEAVLALEFLELQPDLTVSHAPVFRLVSRFLGLFMSSNRLPVNRNRQTGLEPTDLERAREVQMSYLPAEHPVTDCYEIYGYNQSSALVGGDYFDYFSRQSRSVQGVVADACGHGLAAALIMSTFRGMLHAAVADLVRLDDLFTRLNRQVYTRGEILQYLTTVFFDYDEATRELVYFNAGHFDPVILHADGTTENLEGGGPPLGMFPSSAYQPARSHVRPGDLLVLFTDGLVELRDRHDRFFGVEGILKAVGARHNLPLRDLAREVLGEAARWSRGREPEDDLTLFLMRFRESRT